MWAHYCSDHTGAVIGIDVGIAGLEDESQFIINAKNGSVIYTSVRPSALDIEIPPKIDSKTDRSILEKMYLQKSTHWAYEEEVRVVKVINPNFTVLASLTEGKSHEDISIPPRAIKEIYFGYRHNHDSLNTETAKKTSTSDKKSANPHIKFNRCKLDGVTWDLKSTPE
ncbi:hypothetical protein PverR02_16565 [Pseudomonas veronii]|nr:hypothetical protein PverR02_16565 [Pseudomonas veronii]